MRGILISHLIDETKPQRSCRGYSSLDCFLFRFTLGKKSPRFIQDIPFRAQNLILPVKTFQFSGHTFIGLAVARIADGGIPVAGKPPCQCRMASRSNSFVNSGRFVIMASFQLKRTSPPFAKQVHQSTGRISGPSDRSWNDPPPHLAHPSLALDRGS